MSTNASFSEYANHHPDQHAMVFYPSNSKKMLSGHDGGISLTYDITAPTVSRAILDIARPGDASQFGDRCGDGRPGALCGSCLAWPTRGGPSADCILVDRLEKPCLIRVGGSRSDCG